MRRRLRIAFWAGLIIIPFALLFADLLSRSGTAPKAGLRLITVNVNTRVTEVAVALQPLSTDFVLMQETGPMSCSEAATLLGLHFLDGSDQCLLSRWPLAPLELDWPGPWQPPQVAAADAPGTQPLTLVNLRLAIPAAIASLAGHRWYSEEDRGRQYSALRTLLAGTQSALVCGDFNALPCEVDLGAGFHDLWQGFRYGATFPALLPAARIDQCWATEDISVIAARTHRVPSDHRALVVDFARDDGSMAGSP